MIKPAKQVKDEMEITKYVKERLEEISSIIEIYKAMGQSYAKYQGALPTAITDMLKELGYEVFEKKQESLLGMGGSTITIISWINAKDDGSSTCN